MANGDSTLSGLGQGLSKILPYALSAGMGALMGGPMGAVAGLAETKGGEAEYQLQEGTRALDWLKVGLEAQNIQQTGELKKAQLESNEELKRLTLASTQQYRDMSLDQRADEVKQRLLQHQDDQAFMRDYHQSMLALDAQGKQIQAALAGSMEQSRRDSLAERHEENLRSRIAGAEALAQHASETALKDRGAFGPIVRNYLGTASHLDKMSDEEFKKSVYDATFTSELAAQGIGRSEMLDLGVRPDYVDRVAPAAGASPSAKLKGRASSPATTGLPAGKAPKNLWGKTGTINGKRVRIDSMGGVHPL